MRQEGRHRRAAHLTLRHRRTNPRSSRKTPNRDHVVGKWARKRPNQRYGAGQEHEQGGSEPFSLANPSKSPGHKIASATANATAPSLPAPYRRFGRFWTKKSDNMPPRNQKRMGNSTAPQANMTAHAENPGTQSLRGARRQGSSRTATLWIS